MIHVVYLLGLLVALAGMVVLDRRFRLFFWRSAWRAAVVLVVGIAFFLAWDLSGIGLGIFFRGETSFMTGIQLAPELPLEELFFLALLCYLAMDVYGFLTRGSGLSRSGGSSLSRSHQRSTSVRSRQARPAGTGDTP